MDERYQQYKKILRLRNWFVCTPPVLLFTIVPFAFEYFNDRALAFLFFVLVVPMMAFSGLYFEAKTICPWCTQSFFRYKKGGLPDGVSFVFAKQCFCCGEPKSEIKSESK